MAGRILTQHSALALVGFCLLLLSWTISICVTFDIVKRRAKNRRENMSNHNDKLLRDTFKKGFEQQFHRGMLQGATAICGAILNIAKDTTKTPDERVEKIIAFCSVSLNAQEKKEEKAEGSESK